MRYAGINVLRGLESAAVQKELSKLEAQVSRRGRVPKKLLQTIEICRGALRDALRREVLQAANPRHKEQDSVNSEHGKKIGACLLDGEEVFVFTIQHPDPRLPQKVKATGVDNWKHTDVHNREFDDREAAIKGCRDYFKFYQAGDGKWMDPSRITFDKTREV